MILDAEKVPYQIDVECPTRPTAAALAQTCRSFLEPALNAVWSNLYNLSTILQVMPKDLWILKKYKRGPRSIPPMKSYLVRAIHHLSPMLSFTDVPAYRHSSAPLSTPTGIDSTTTPPEFAKCLWSTIPKEV